jgi:YVTN family beta-propeller protein
VVGTLSETYNRSVVPSVAVCLVAMLLLGGFVTLATRPTATSDPPASWASSVPLRSSGPSLPPRDAAAGLAVQGGSPSAEPLGSPGPGIGSVLSTIDLIANRTLPGAAGVSPELYPQYGLYDPANGQIFVRDSEDNEAAVGVLSTATGQMVADITTPGGSEGSVITPTIAYDSKTGFIYATNANTGAYPGNVSIIDPVTDQVTGSVTVGYSPDGIAYDPANNELYVANEGTHNVTVISGANNRTVANIATRQDPAAIVFDPITNQVFVADYDPTGSVTVISTVSNTAIANLTVGTYPYALALDTQDDYVDVLNLSSANYDGLVTEVQAGSSPSIAGTLTVGLEPTALAYDPSNDYLYVTNTASTVYDNVSVFNQSSGKTVGSIVVGSELYTESIAYDPVGGDMFVSAYGGNNVSIVNTSTDTVLASISTYRLGGLGPLGLVVDPVTGNVYTLNEGDELTAPTSTEISPSSHAAIDTISLATNPRGFTYEAAGNSLVVGNAGGNNTYFLNASTYAVDRETAAGRNPEFTAYDGATGTTYTLDPTSDNVTAVNAAGQPIASIPIGVGVEVQSMVFNSFDGDLYVASEAGNVTVINGSTNTHLPEILLHAMEPWGSAYDSHNHDVYVANYESKNVSVIGPSNTVIRSISVGNNPISVAFDSENDTIWVANVGSANVTVINDTSQSPVTSVPLSTSPNLLEYDPANNAVYNDPGYPYELVAYNASTYAELPGSPLVYTSVAGTLGSMGYDPATHDLLVADLTSGAIYVIGAPPAPTYTVSFVESGLLASTPWSVTLNGSMESSTTGSIAFQAANGTGYAYTIGTVAGYTANVTSGTLSVAGASVTVDIQFTAPHAPQSYPVTFTETGLPATTLWTVTLNGTVGSSTTASIAYTELDGTYPFTIGALAGYTSNRTSGSVGVLGAAVTVEIQFNSAAASYLVTFVESGLPASTTWSVTLSSQPNSASTATIQFTEGNGTDPFTVGTVPGYTPAPASGSITVDGAPANQNVVFTAAPAALSVTLTADPGTLTVGSSTTLTATVTGGSSPFTYAYTCLPPGCSSTAASFSCTPTQSGTFNATVTVSDLAGQSAQANATITVQSNSSTPGPSSQGGTSYVLWGLVAPVIVAVGLILFLVAWRRRRKVPEPPTAASGSPPPTT